MANFLRSVVAKFEKRQLLVKSLFAAVALATTLSVPVKAVSLSSTGEQYAYAANFAVSGSFYLSYDYELVDGAYVRRMRVFESGKLGLINAPIESVVWSETTDEASFYGRFVARGVPYTLRADLVLFRGIRCAQFFVYDSKSKLVAQGTLTRATVSAFSK
jgi:hypothetical protein